MDDISRGSSPEDSGAAPVSERQKGPEELVRFERGHVDEVGEHSSVFESEDRFAATAPATHMAADREAVQGSAEVDEARSDEARIGDSRLGASAEAPMSGPGEDADEPVEPVAGEPVGPQHAGTDAARAPEPAEGLGEDAAASEGGDEGAPAEIDEDSARAAVEAEQATASIEQDLDEILDTDLGEDGLPVVPELTDVDELSRVLFVLMLSSRDGMTVFRLAQACNSSQKLVEQALDQLQQQLRAQGLPVELTRVGDTVRWMSTASTFPYLQRLRGVKKLEKLSPAALETLAVIAYRQPVMRSEIEAIRGVKAGPMLRTLLQHKLVKVAGRADVPGRPLQYGTTPHVLERFGLASLQDLPSVKEWKNLG